jgi:phosphatidylserine decarboxylase
MGAQGIVSGLAGFLLLFGSASLFGFLFWRYVWFFRNPGRTPPAGDAVLSPADGTVVYVKAVPPEEDVIVIKEGVKATVTDILREDLPRSKILIGIFMSPFDVHFNRAPISGEVRFVTHHPPVRANLHMGSMHFRTLFGRMPFYRNSLHILQNERTVTRIEGQCKGRELSCYVVQIAGGSVRGIDSYVRVGQRVERGAVFGMIRIGSQVDLIIPSRDDLQIQVQPGDRVRAGVTILVQ